MSNLAAFKLKFVKNIHFIIFRNWNLFNLKFSNIALGYCYILNIFNFNYPITIQILLFHYYVFSLQLPAC